jgi:hypothetical protein
MGEAKASSPLVGFVGVGFEDSSVFEEVAGVGDGVEDIFLAP